MSWQPDWHESAELSVVTHPFFDFISLIHLHNIEQFSLLFLGLIMTLTKKLCLMNIDAGVHIKVLPTISVAALLEV